MNFLRKLIEALPRPFKYIQRQLHIQNEWQEFKVNMRPHRYKLYFVILVALYPQNLQKIKHFLTLKTHHSLEPDQPTFQIADNLVKNLISSILSDNQIKKEGINFVQQIINDQNFVGQILLLLQTALKNKEFLNNVGQVSKQLVIHQLKDPLIQQELKHFIQKIASSQKTKHSFIKLIEQVFSSKESVDVIVNLLKQGISANQVKESLSETVNYTVKELLTDEETINQLRVFIFFLLKKFENDDEIKGMMDILFAKGVGMFKKEKKHPELDRILKISREKPTDYL